MLMIEPYLRLRTQERRSAEDEERPLRYLFGYGVKPMRVFMIWLPVILAFATAYWICVRTTTANSFPGDDFYYLIVVLVNMARKY